MRVVVDAAIFTGEAGAFGNVSGALNLPFEPQIGDTISFIPTAKGGELPPGFAGQARVEGRVIAAGSDKGELIISLEDIHVDSVTDAEALVAFFEHAHGLFANIYDDGDAT